LTGSTLFGKAAAAAAANRPQAVFYRFGLFGKALAAAAAHALRLAGKTFEFQFERVGARGKQLQDTLPI